MIGVNDFPLDTAMLDRLRTAFAAQLPAFLPLARWFGSKARQIQEARMLDYIPIRLPQTTALITLARLEYTEGPGETYVLPLIPSRAGVGPPGGSLAPILHISTAEPSEEILFLDGLSDRDLLSEILDFVRAGGSHPGASGELAAIGEPMLRTLALGPPSELVPRPLRGEQSNTSILYGDRLILKFFRRLEEGVNPELEMGRFLTETAHFPNIPPLCGSLEYRTPQGKTMVLGILEGFVPNQGDAWSFFTASLRDLCLEAGRLGPKELSALASAPPREFQEALPKALAEQLGKQLNLLGLLGKRTAEMHVALASAPADAAFAPEPFTVEFGDALEGSFHDLAVRNFDLLRQKLPELPDPIRELGRNVMKLEDDVLLAFHSCLEGGIASPRTRIHGDYHLGQVLFTGTDFFIIDFEGEPAKPLAERRTKRSPIQDVAGMLRSFHYAARTAFLAAETRLGEAPQPKRAVERLAKNWQGLSSARFLEAYKGVADAATGGGAPPQEFDRLLRLHLLEKAVYELGYELNNRPAWLAIPLGGIEETLGAIG